jgi:hypothetical protein
MSEETVGRHEGESLDSPEATHYLHLSNGDVVEHYGAIPTEYGDADKTYRVVAAFDRK